jgi:hypothetical protein
MTRTFASLVLFSIATAALAQVPRFTNAESYANVQKRLLEQGWKPARPPGAEPCGYHPACELDKGEIVNCAGTGLAQCLALWRKGPTVIEVITEGENPILASLRCIRNCPR